MENEVGSKFEIGDLVTAKTCENGKVDGIILARHIIRINFTELDWEYLIKFVNKKGSFDLDWAREKNMKILITGIFE